MDKISLEELKEIKNFRIKAENIRCLFGDKSYNECRKKGKNIAYVCDPNPTHSWLASRKDTNSFKYVFDYNMTEEVIDIAIEKNPMNIQFIPTELRSFEVCLKAIKLNWKAILYIPSDLRKCQIATEAVKGSAEALAYIPSKHQTPDVIMEAIQKNFLSAQFADSEAFSFFEKYINSAEGIDVFIDEFNKVIKDKDEAKENERLDKIQKDIERKNKPLSDYQKRIKDYRNGLGNNE